MKKRKFKVGDHVVLDPEVFSAPRNRCVFKIDGKATPNMYRISDVNDPEYVGTLGEEHLTLHNRSRNLKTIKKFLGIKDG